jgi:hypothetical protein
MISWYRKTHLKIGGLIIAINSHADAGVAHLEKDYKLVAIINATKGQIEITDQDLEAYFVPRGEVQPTIENLMESAKGIKYSQRADDYIFKRITWKKNTT